MKGREKRNMECEESPLLQKKLGILKKKENIEIVSAVSVQNHKDKGTTDN